MADLYQPHTHTIGPGAGEELITVHDLGGLTEPEIRQMVHGEPGTPGQDGGRGPEGERGPQGPSGGAGADGHPGSTGQQGPTGPQGGQGDKGDPGTNAGKGDKGDKGDQGDAGPPGALATTLPNAMYFAKGAKVTGFQAGATGWDVSGLKNIMITDSYGNVHPDTGDLGDLVFIYNAKNESENGIYIKSNYAMHGSSTTWHKIAGL